MKRGVDGVFDFVDQNDNELERDPTLTIGTQPGLISPPEVRAEMKTEFGKFTRPISPPSRHVSARSKGSK